MDPNSPCQPEWQPPEDCPPEQPELIPICVFEVREKFLVLNLF